GLVLRGRRRAAWRRRARLRLRAAPRRPRGRGVGERLAGPEPPERGRVCPPDHGPAPLPALRRRADDDRVPDHDRGGPRRLSPRRAARRARWGSGFAFTRTRTPAPRRAPPRPRRPATPAGARCAGTTARSPPRPHGASP